MSLRTELLSEIDTFCTKQGVSDSTFGRRAFNDPNFMLELRAGRNLTLKMVDAARMFMATGERQRVRNIPKKARGKSRKARTCTR